MNPDDLITTWMPRLRNHILAHYRWMERRDCILSVDDLTQIASITLWKLAARWDEIVAEGGDRYGEHTGGLFWAFLKTAIKSDVLNYLRDQSHVHPDLQDPIHMSALLSDDGEPHTALRVREESPLGALVRTDVVEYFDMMSRHDKMLIALRYFDELPSAQVGARVRP